MGETRGGKGGRYHANFRRRERDKILGWIEAGASGSVVGLAGAGKSNLIRYLCYHQNMDAVRGMNGRLVTLISIDLHDLPDLQIATLYRTILRSLHEGRGRFGQGMQEIVSERYRQHLAVTDPFVLQSVLRGLLLHLHEQRVQLVLVLDRFDDFCVDAEPKIVNTLKGLRDSFKDTLYFLVGMRQEAAYLPTGMLGELYEVVDSQTCWVGPMSREDTVYMLTQQARQAQRPLSPEAVEQLWRLSGGYPSLVRVASDWWRLEGYKRPFDTWEETLRYSGSIQHRLEEIWKGLPEDEQDVMVAVQAVWAETAVSPPIRARQEAFSQLAQRQQVLLQRLVDKGLVVACGDHLWQLFSPLFAHYVQETMLQGQASIWQDEETGTVYQGQRILHLTALERSLLLFFLSKPQAIHTRATLIEKIWPDDNLQETRFREAGLYQVISGLRRKVEPYRGEPRYIITAHGSGYQFFPDGKDEGDAT